jgi:leader peptidase (prepilin peptidase) / N-methyltransferase
MAATLLAASLAVTLAAVTISDLRTRQIPNRFLAAAVLVLAAVVPALDPASLPERLLACAGAGGFLGLAHALRPEGMGFGDVKLAAVLGLYLGYAVATALLVALCLGAVTGLALRLRAVPLAPFLATGAAVACLPLSTVSWWS